MPHGLNGSTHGDDAAHTVSTYPNMKVLVPWLHQELPTALSSAFGDKVGQLDSLAPLHIDSEPGVGGGHGHKEIWNPKNCEVALSTTGLYEAGANMCWIDLCLDSSTGDGTLPLEEPDWGNVTHMAKQFFSHEVDISNGPMLFPFHLEAYLTDGTVLGTEGMPRAVLKILGGQGIVFAWYVAVARALARGDMALVKQQWYAARSCTIRLRSGMSLAKLAMASMEMSERLVGAQSLCETFIHWADKLKFIEDEHGLASKTGQAAATSLKALGVSRYRGAEITKTMVLAAHAVRELFDDKVRGAAVLLDKEFGRDVLSMQYSKMSRLLSTVKTRPRQWHQQIT